MLTQSQEDRKEVLLDIEFMQVGPPVSDFLHLHANPGTPGLDDAGTQAGESRSSWAVARLCTA